MKRQQEEPASQKEEPVPQRKAVKYNQELTLLTLPTDILDLIFQDLSRQDAINLSTLDHKHRNVLKAIVFSRIRASWSDMRSEIDGRTGFLKQHRHLVTQLRIVDCDSYGEWNMDIFSDLLIDLPRLRHLLINSKFSSNWLKYRQDDNLQQLTLYFEPQDTRQVPGEIVSSSSTTTTTTTINRIFSLEHIANFKMLTKLRLWHYHLYWEDVYPVLIVEDVELHNCTWEFPFTLSQFNYNSNIRRLVVSYAEGNAFAVSERYREFLQYGNGEDFSSLEELTVTVARGSLNSSVMSRFMNTGNFPRLRSLRVLAREGAYNLSHWFGKLPTNSTLRVLDMQVDYEARDRERALKEANRYFPFLDVKIHRP